MADKIIGNAPSYAGLQVGNTSVIDPEMEREQKLLAAAKAGGDAYKSAIKEDNKDQVATSLANAKVKEDPTKNFEEEKAKAIANIESGEAKAHGDENNEPDKNPLVNKDLNNPETGPSPKNPEMEGVKQEAKQDPQTRWKMKSIMQAYYDGSIDKSTRNYMLANAVATFARNTGKDLANVAAAYTGGSVDNERDTSLWEARNQQLAKSAIESEQTGVEGSKAWQEAQMSALQRKAQDLKNWSSQDTKNLVRLIESKMYDKNGNFIGDPTDMRNKEMFKQIQALKSGGAVNESILKEMLTYLITM